MFEKPKVSNTLATVKNAVVRAQKKPLPTKPASDVTTPEKTTPTDVNFDNLKKEPRQLGKTPRTSKAHITGPSAQFEDAAMSVGGGEVPSLTDPNVGAAVERKKKQINQYKSLLRGIMRRKPVL